MSSVTLSKGILTAAVKGLAMVVPQRPAMTVFGCTKIIVKGGQIRMIGTDLEQWVDYRNDGVDGDAEFLFKLGDLKELLKLPVSDGQFVFEALPEGRVNVTVQINGIDNTREYKVPEVSEFPEEPVVEASPLAIGPEFFLKLRLAQPMLLKDKVNPVMGCFSLAEGRIVATNRRELVVMNYELGLEEPILLPPPKILSLMDTSGTLARKDSLVELKSGMWKSIVKLPPGKFPCYEQIVPKPSTLTTEFTLGDEDWSILLTTLTKLKIDEKHEPVTLYGSKDGVFALAGLNSPTVISLAGSRFNAEKPGMTLHYTVSQIYLINALKCGFRRFRSSDGHLLVAQSDKLGGYLIIMSLSGYFDAGQIAASVAKVPAINNLKKEIETMSNPTQVPARNEVKPATSAPAAPTSESPDYKVVNAAPVDPFAALNTAIDQLHVALYSVNTAVNDVCKQVREAQRSVKQRERTFKELQVTIDRFKKVANF